MAPRTHGLSVRAASPLLPGVAVALRDVLQYLVCTAVRTGNAMPLHMSMHRRMLIDRSNFCNCFERAGASGFRFLP
jgi:hypothetical protein